MGVSVFVSRPTPYEPGQRLFLQRIIDHLADRGLVGRTIGETDYGREPMPHIRSVMADCNGLLGVAFRRFLVNRGRDRPGGPDRGHGLGTVVSGWLTTPYLHLEAAIAYSLGLPILLIAESGVILEGALESGVLQMYPPLFETHDDDAQGQFLSSPKWRQLVSVWEGEVREVSRNKGLPPRLYGKC